MKIQDKLNEFNNKQITKFLQVEKKHPDNSVTKDDSDFWQIKGGIDETQVNNANDLISQLEFHLIEEVCEYFGMKELAHHIMYMIKSEKHRVPKDLQLSSYKSKECIDISNLSFLIWCLKNSNPDD